MGGYLVTYADNVARRDPLKAGRVLATYTLKKANEVCIKCVCYHLSEGGNLSEGGSLTMYRYTKCSLRENIQ